MGGEACQLVSGFLTEGMDPCLALEMVCPRREESPEFPVPSPEVPPIKFFIPSPTLRLTIPSSVASVSPSAGKQLSLLLNPVKSL